MVPKTYSGNHFKFINDKANLKNIRERHRVILVNKVR